MTSLIERRLEWKWKTILKAMAAEFVGCFFLNLFGCGAALATSNYGYTMYDNDQVAYDNQPDRFTYGADYQVMVSIAFGVVFGLDVALFQDVSGAHVNPAITLGMISVKNIHWLQGLMYMPCQFAGSIVGSLVLKQIVPDLLSRDSVFNTHVYQKHGMTSYHGLVWVIVTALQLMLVYLEAREETLTSTRSAAPIVIGIASMANHLASLHATGGSMNPAQALGSAIASNNYQDLWVYVLAAPIGTVIGATLHYTAFRPEPEEVEDFEERVKVIRKSLQKED